MRAPRIPSRPIRTARAARACALLALATLAFACAKAEGPGGHCIASADCEDHLRCFLVDATSSRRCLAPCDPATTVLCSPEGEGSLGLCAPVAGATPGGACLVGGEVEPGDECAASIDCAASGICVVDGATATCERACDTAAPDCPAAESCQAIAGSEPRGYCVPSTDGGT